MMAGTLRASQAARTALRDAMTKRFPGDTPRYDLPGGFTTGGNALAATLGAAGSSPAGGMPMAGGNALAPGNPMPPQGGPPEGLPPSSPMAPPGLPTPAAPTPDVSHDQALASMLQQLGGAKLPAAALQQHQASLDGAFHAIGRLLEKGPGVSHGDVAEAIRDAVQTGVVSPTQGATFAAAMQAGGGKDVAGALRAQMAKILTMGVAVAQHQQAQQQVPTQQPSQPPQPPGAPG